jgi:hypothetical protein
MEGPASVLVNKVSAGCVLGVGLVSLAADCSSLLLSLGLRDGGLVARPVIARPLYPRKWLPTRAFPESCLSGVES